MSNTDNEMLMSIISSPYFDRFYGSWNTECHWVSNITKEQLKWMIKKKWLISTHGKFKSKNNFKEFNHETEGIAFTPLNEIELLIKLIV
jgi:hypothetical protein